MALMKWYTAEFSDKGAGMNKQTFYVEGESKEDARELAKRNASNDMDPESVIIRPMDGVSYQDILKKVFMAGGYNTAYTESGEEISRSDVEKVEGRFILKE